MYIFPTLNHSPPNPLQSKSAGGNIYIKRLRNHRFDNKIDFM